MIALPIFSGLGARSLLSLSCALSCSLGWVAQTAPVQAQPIVPNQLLPGFAPPSQVNAVTSIPGCSSNCFELTGGVRQGDNLFHSFSEFGVPTQGAAIFQHASTIENIFTRVTGGQVSQIDGLLGTEGASLYLLNSNGILFGPNARLDVADIFVAGTGRRFIARPNSLGLGLLSTDTTEPVRLFSYGTNEVRMQFEGATGAGIEVAGDASLPPLNPNGGFSLGLFSGDIAIRDRRVTVPTQQLVLGGFKDEGDAFLHRAKMTFRGSPAAENAADVLIERSELRGTDAVANGEIRIRAFDLDIRDSTLQTFTTPLGSTGGPPSMDNPIRGDVRFFVEQGDIAITNSTVEATASPGAASGEIRLIRADNVTLDNSRLTVSTAGDWGQIVAPRLLGDLRLRNGSVIEAIATGDPAFAVGRIDLTAAGISLEDGSRIVTQSSVVDAPLGTGNINLNLQEQLSLTGASELSVGYGDGAVAADVGDVAVRASQISLDGASAIRSDTQASGGNILLLGDIALESGSLLQSQSQALGGNLTLSGAEIALAEDTSIQAFSQGQGGNVSLLGTNLSLANQSIIQTETLGTGGNITLTLLEQLSFTGETLIQATATEPGGGNIRVQAATLDSSGATNADILYAGLNDPSRLTLDLGLGGDFFFRLTERDRFPRGDNISQIGYRLDQPLVIPVIPEVELIPEPTPPAAPEPSAEPAAPLLPPVMPLSSEEEVDLSLASDDEQEGLQPGCRRAEAPSGSLTLRGREGVAASPNRLLWPQSLSDLGSIHLETEVASKAIRRGLSSGLGQLSNPRIEPPARTIVNASVALGEAMGWTRDRQGRITLVKPRQLATAALPPCNLANS